MSCQQHFPKPVMRRRGERNPLATCTTNSAANPPLRFTQGRNFAFLLPNAQKQSKGSAFFLIFASYKTNFAKQINTSFSLERLQYVTVGSSFSQR